MNTDQTKQNDPNLSYDDLSHMEKQVYDAALLNVPVRLIGQRFGFRGEAGRQQFCEKYRHVLALAHFDHQLQLRGAQWDAAVNDKNPTMLVWLGKQAGQSDVVPVALGEESSDVAVDPTVVNIVYPEKPKWAEKQE